MKILIKVPKEPIRVDEVSKIDLDSLQKYVKGWIEIVQLRYYVRLFRNKSYILIVNEEGLINAMDINFVLPDTGTRIHGPIVAAKLDTKGDVTGLTDQDIETITNYLEEITYGKRTSESLV